MVYFYLITALSTSQIYNEKQKIYEGRPQLNKSTNLIIESQLIMPVVYVISIFLYILFQC